MALPEGSADVRWIQTCGLIHSNSFKVPATVVVLFWSNIAKEWCAKAGAAKTVKARKDKAVALKFMSVSRSAGATQGLTKRGLSPLRPWLRAEQAWNARCRPILCH